jgi:hypothetical protein
MTPVSDVSGVNRISTSRKTARQEDSTILQIAGKVFNGAVDLDDCNPDGHDTDIRTRAKPEHNQ